MYKCTTCTVTWTDFRKLLVFTAKNKRAFSSEYKNDELDGIALKNEISQVFLPSKVVKA